MDNRKYLKEKNKMSSLYGDLLEPMEKAAENGDPLARILLLGKDNAPLYLNKVTGEISEKEN